MKTEEQERILSQLKDRYDEARIERKPEIPNTTARPDYGIRAEGSRSLMLLVNYSSMRTRHRRREDITSLKRMMEAANVDFGALVSDKIEYVFELFEYDGEIVERELPGFPDSDDRDFDNVLSQEELVFRLWNVSDYLRDKMPNDEYHYYLYHGLFRKLVAEQEGLPTIIDEIDAEWIHKVDQLIANRYPSYSRDIAPQDVEIQRRILQAFEEVDLEALPPSAAEGFTNLIEKSRSASESLTPHSVANALVDLAGIEDGDTVLDPAAGLGNVGRAAARRGAAVSAIEINPETTNHALFLNAVFGFDVDYKVGDFLEFAREEHSNLPRSVDHAIIDPPFGLHYKRPDGTFERNAEERLILESLERVRPGGTVTAVLNQGSLYKQQSSDFRDRITTDYRLAAIIELDKPVFQHTAVPTAILHVVKELPGDDDEIRYHLVDQSDDEIELDRAVQAIRDNQAPTLLLTEFRGESLLPSEISGLEVVKTRLRRRYEELVELGEQSIEIRTGTTAEPSPEATPSSLPFLRPKDVSKGGPDRYIVETDDAVTAGPRDVLVSVKGSTSVVHRPEETVVPSSNWAILRFGSQDAAIVYSLFLQSEAGQDQLEMIRGGATVPFIPLRRLREVLVPHFNEEDLAEKAAQLRSLRAEADEYERMSAELRAQLEELI